MHDDSPVLRRGVYVPQTYICRVISYPVPPLPLGQPDHHID